MQADMGIPSMGREDDVTYDGSRAFLWLADWAGMPLDQVNFLLTQFVALCAAFVFRYRLHPQRVSSDTRHGAALLLGLSMAVFCFGRHALHLACLSTICYGIIMTAHPKIAHKLVLISSLLYLSAVHLKRQLYSYGAYTLDISGPLMILTQKVTSLAFSLHDGLAKRPEDLTPYQRQQVIRKIPNPLEYYSYVFHFHALMAGPTVLFADYLDFIRGEQFSKRAADLVAGKHHHTVSGEPSSFGVVAKKLTISIVCALFFVKIVPTFPITRIYDDDFVKGTSLWYKTFYIICATTVVRSKYYHAWLLADAICNASGLGFGGYDPDGKPTWDLISNVDIFKFEFGLSLRDSIEQWNKCTTRWLRFVVYERVTEHRTFLTYGLSAIWHGFYPGYYLTFLGGAMFTLGSRAVRRSIRPLFAGNRFSRTFYHGLTFLATRVAMGYLTFSFVALDFWPSVRLYAYMYFWYHILCLLAIYVLPVVIPPPRRGEKRSIPEPVLKTGVDKAD